MAPLDNAAVDTVIAQTVDILRREGARFAYLYGSRTPTRHKTRTST